MEPEPVFPKYEGYLSDESRLRGYAQAIVFPQNTAELAQALRQAARDGIRVTVQGARTGLAGGGVPQGGLIVNLTRMNEAPVFERSGADAHLFARAGVTLDQIGAEAASRGLFFPPDPTEGTATLGGAYATGASGLGGLRFGQMSRFIDGLGWVTPSGAVWRVNRGEHSFDETGCPLPDGRRLIRRLSGMDEGADLIDFLSGSEGHLGVAADFRLRLAPEYAHVWGVVFFFSDDGAALAFARRLYGWRQAAHEEALFACEYFNGSALELIAAGGEGGGSPASLPAFPRAARAALYVELRGDDPAALEGMLGAQLGLLAEAGGNAGDTWAQNGPGVHKLREMRHKLVEAIHSRSDAREGLRLNACFSAAPERFAECLGAYREGLAQSGLDGAIYGHLFENRLHVSLCGRGEGGEDSCAELFREFVRTAEQFGGLRAPEYGEGKLARAWDDTASRAAREKRLRALRAFFDPSGILGG